MASAYDGSGAVDLSGVLSEIQPPILETPSAAVLSSPKSGKDLFAEKNRRDWAHGDGARCDFQSRPMLAYRTGLFFLAVWKRSVYGKTLTEIKADDAMIPKVAEATAALLADVFGNNLAAGDWAIITTPKRRHLQRNFASLVADRIASLLGIPFYEDVALCRSKQRVNATFTMNLCPSEQNIIVFDDFVTTGQTMLSMKRLFQPTGKILVFVAGINNKA
jgi:hypothetical protein